MEKPVKVVKNLISEAIKDHQDPFLAILDWGAYPQKICNSPLLRNSLVDEPAP